MSKKTSIHIKCRYCCKMPLVRMTEISFCRIWDPYCLWLPAARRACHPQPSIPGSGELVSFSNGT